MVGANAIICINALRANPDATAVVLFAVCAGLTLAGLIALIYLVVKLVRGL